MRQVTIQEVAKAAGVSPSSVSNLLNGRGDRMQASTQQRITKAIEELGYRPNRAARQLRTGRAATMGLIVPSIGNPFWGAFARHLESAARSRGYNVLLCNSEREPDREREYVDQLWDDGVHGVVLCTSLRSLEHLTPAIDRGLRLVTFDRPAQPEDPASVVSISIDNRVGMYMATTHLLELGHTRLAFVSGSLRSVNRASRYAGFRAAIEDAGLDADKMPVWSGTTAKAPFGDVEAAEMGRRAARELLGKPNAPTAIVAINDMTALGVCRGVRDLGLGVGGDVSVVGFDDIVLAELYEPPLTTVRQPIAQMAELSAEEIVGHKAAGGAGRSVLLRPELVVRDSSASPSQADEVSSMTV